MTTYTAEGNEALRNELRDLLNKHSAENGSHTPDFILARYLMDCLRAFDLAVAQREDWYARMAPGPAIEPNALELGAAARRAGIVR